MQGANESLIEVLEKGEIEQQQRSDQILAHADDALENNLQDDDLVQIRVKER